MKIEHYKTLLRVLDLASQKPIPNDDLHKDANNILIKHLFHAHSAFYLSKGTFINGINSYFVDYPSIYLLCESSLESFLGFYYIYCEPQDIEESKFRHLTWVYSGLKKRQIYLPMSPVGIARLRKEKEQIESFKNDIEEHRSFKQLDRKKKDCIIGGNYRLKNWADIGISAGLSSLHAKVFYSFLCEYAHTGYLSVLQLSQAKEQKIQIEFSNTALSVALIAMANMFMSYSEVIPEVKQTIINNAEYEMTVKLYYELGQADRDELKDAVDWDKFTLE